MPYVFRRTLLLFLHCLILIIASQNNAAAASLQLSWADNSPNEDGFYVERKLGADGNFSRIGTVGADVSSYTDSNLVESTMYCYRVNAFNSVGESAYSGEVCGTTSYATPPPPQTFLLSISYQGSGTVISKPPGITCGDKCSAEFPRDASVRLQANAASGYAFTRWNGDPDCSDGSVTLNSNKSCVAVFTANVNQNPKLLINVVGKVTTAGTGSGSVTSNPIGIDCGATCAADFSKGATVALTAAPGSGSVFSGWSGDPDCSDGVVTMNRNKTCTATFAANASTVNIGIKGKGRVIGHPGSIDCATDCSVSFAAPTRIILRAVPLLGSTFVGWSGDRECMDGVIMTKGDRSCVAVFEQRPSSVGIFKTTTHEWQLKGSITASNGNCSVDACIDPWKKRKIPSLEALWLPIIGNWNASGKDDLGIYFSTASASKASQWYLDRNGNGKWNGCDNDRCFRSFGQKGDLPVAADWNGTGSDKIGVFRPSTGEWFLDLDGNGKWDGCNVDRCVVSFGEAGDLPVAGDWNGTGHGRIGVFRPSSGEWFLDLNGNGQWDGCNVDQCIAGFGEPADLPVVGDWNATGSTKIGIFRPSSGEWFLDLNGNGQWDECNIDRCITGFGQQGDLPVAGRW